MKIADKLAEASKQPITPRRRFLAKALPVFVYSFFFPALLFIFPKYILDYWLQFPTFLNPTARVVLGVFLIIPGAFFLFSSISSQRKVGLGTPMPLMATQKLVIQKPYSYCRNPLFFGLIILFGGISILINSISSMVMVLIFTLIILLYVKLIEEKELEKRFGDEYLAYKEATPFLIPTINLNRSKK
jgi:protein-S-isoprenylcysteine O-methyltransferase Ste14